MLTKIVDIQLTNCINSSDYKLNYIYNSLRLSNNFWLYSIKQTQNVGNKLGLRLSKIDNNKSFLYTSIFL